MLGIPLSSMICLANLVLNAHLNAYFNSNIKIYFQNTHIFIYLTLFPYIYVFIEEDLVQEAPALLEIEAAPGILHTRHHGAILLRDRLQRPSNNLILVLDKYYYLNLTILKPPSLYKINFMLMPCHILLLKFTRKQREPKKKSRSSSSSSRSRSSSKNRSSPGKSKKKDNKKRGGSRETKDKQE